MSCIQNISCRSVVLLQLDDFSILEILLEFQDISDVGTSPLVDALVIVANYAYIIMRFRQHLYERVLYLVGILILVYHYVFESSLVFEKCRFVFFKELNCLQQQVVEVHGVVLLECLLIAIIDLMSHL